MNVRTVLGELPADQLGVTDAHDHLFFRSMLLPGQELDDREAATREVQAFADAGGRTIVQWTPYGLGRRAADLAKISADTGIHLVTGEGPGIPYLLTGLRPRLIRQFGAEIATQLFIANPARAFVTRGTVRE